MQVDRVLAAFLSWENKAERNAAEQSSVNVTADDAVAENGSEVAAYQPRVSSPPVAFSAGSQRSNSPTSVLQYEPQVRKCPPVSLVADKYMILDELEGSSLNMCVNIHTKEDFVCKIVPKENSSNLLSAHYLLDSHPHINKLHEVILGDKFLYLIFPPSHGDLHSYVRQRKRLKDTEAKKLFKQIVETVRACHEQGIVLRDLKLRKFVFADSQRTHIRLETLEDAILLEDIHSDELQDKRGCPAYVSPEILRSHAKYSGRAADIWSLGIILYTMLVGRYPFNDLHHSSLFAKISRGYFTIPENLSPKAKCLIRSLLRRDPNERLPAGDILDHPWFTHRSKYYSSSHDNDQIVPDIDRL
ncbi:tribbles homolog 2-like [Planococcus citri]|uniref:tribbles homolog 2-like n=1 Tax=Planococcus citri TaxID=170843 RepID=UPI0031F813B5